MTLTFARLLEYFGVKELQDVLREINEPRTGKRPELAKRVHTKWLTYNRTVEDLLDFLDNEMLATICYDHKLGDRGNRETLKRRIKKELKGINKQKQQNSDDMNRSFQIERKTKVKNNHVKSANIVVICLVIAIAISVIYVNFYGISPMKTIALTTTGGFLVQQNPNFPPDINMIINFKTTSLSAQNPIEVEAKMIPSEYFNAYHPDPWPYLPNSQLVLFPYAIKYPQKQFSDGSYAQGYVNLTKKDNPREYSGTGKILYQTEGDFGYFFVGPQEMKAHFVNDGAKFTLDEINNKMNKQTLFHVSSDQTVMQTTGKYSTMIGLVGFAISIVKYRNKISDILDKLRK